MSIFYEAITLLCYEPITRPLAFLVWHLTAKPYVTALIPLLYFGGSEMTASGLICPVVFVHLG